MFVTNSARAPQLQTSPSCVAHTLESATSIDIGPMPASSW